ncbi:MAG TPA: 3-phosphoshikimate 1-carboxyvinyltransferase [Puia sp.]|nr:3-phosphoshikimate 1-carboxyvinyltransferase [Puia sp.]
MLTTIKRSTLKGTIQAPASKSSMQRACAAALLSRGVTYIYNPGHSNDDKAALGVIRALGAEVFMENDGTLRVAGQGVRPGTGAVNCGESGLGIRMFAPIIALSGKPVKVNGEGSLLSRPMDFFDEIFPQLGIRVVSNKGKLPLEIQGPLQPRDIVIDGSLSSQFLTGLLFAYAAGGAREVSIRVNNLKSRPYIDLTLQVLRHFGWKVENRNYEEFYFPGVTAAAESRSYTVEGDWSGGAFLLVAGAVAGPITVKGLDTASTQADKAILQALKDCGAAIRIGEGEMEIGPASLKAFQFDATDCPDLFPPLVALASYCHGTTLIEGVSRLAHKESNRGLTLQDEFGKMGVTVGLDGDRMRVQGGKVVKGAVVHSRHDHRIAMACAVAALSAEGETTIEEAQAINKSYPDFYDHIQQLGAGVNNKTQLV